MAQRPHAGAPVKAAQQARLIRCRPFAGDMKVAAHPGVAARSCQVVIGMVDQRDQAAHREPGHRVRRPAAPLCLHQGGLAGLAVQEAATGQVFEQREGPGPGKEHGQRRRQHQFDQGTQFASQTCDHLNPSGAAGGPVPASGWGRRSGTGHSAGAPRRPPDPGCRTGRR